MLKIIFRDITQRMTRRKKKPEEGVDPRIKLTDADLAWIQDQRAKGKMLKWAAAVVGVAVSTVTRRLAKLNAVAGGRS